MYARASGRARFRALISGRVQLVGFRAFAEIRAHRHGVTGYVCNLPAGQVEVVAEGDRRVLEGFLADLHHGPRGARVDSVLVSWEPYRGEYPDFSIGYGR